MKAIHQLLYGVVGMKGEGCRFDPFTGELNSIPSMRHPLSFLPIGEKKRFTIAQISCDFIHVRQLHDVLQQNYGP